MTGKRMAQGKRLLSIDTLRGLDMIFIMGLAELVVCICELFPGGSDCALAMQMHHAAWNGLRHHDTIFPLFLFIAGMTFPFSYAKQLERGATRPQVYRKILTRALVLVLLGMVYNGLFELDWGNLRCASVLGRIGVAWALAAVLYVNCPVKARAVIALAILVGYWLLVAYVPAPDAPPGEGPLTLDGCIVGYVDRLLLPGRLHNGNFDPEGILSTLPAVVTAMLGMFTGEFVRIPDEKIPGGKKTLMMMGAAAVMAVAGLVWSTVFPINKRLWTSSFTLVVGAFSLFCYALVYYIVEVRGLTGWTLPFRVIGLNSITIYLAQRIIPLEGVSEFFLGGLAGLLPGSWGSVLLAAGYLLVSWLLLYFLYRQKIFLKV